jgi:hypothetical protein
MLKKECLGPLELQIPKDLYLTPFRVDLDQIAGG